MAITKTNTILSDVNLTSADSTFIYVHRKKYAYTLSLDWNDKREVQWSKYQIKESDMRVKTANFTTNQYLDLTTGLYTVLITSPYHEDFGGVIISVEFDDDKELYTYQCQDFSRFYQSKFDLITKNTSVYNILRCLITRGEVKLKGATSKSLKKNSKLLSGLRPAWQYWERAWGGVMDYNPMTTKKNMIIRNKSYIEAIRSLVFGLGTYIDVYFDKYGILHFEPFVKDEWLNTGLYLTTPEIMSAKHKFDTTNVITNVMVYNTDKLKTGKYYSSETLLNLDLSAFFGYLTSSVENPDQNNETSNGTGKKDKSKTKNNTNVYNTKKKHVYLCIDNIDGKTSDKKKLDDMTKILKNNGWKVTNLGIGPNKHYSERGKVKKGVLFCLYGGVCAGTLKEACSSKDYLNPLKKNKSRVVVGFFPPASSIKKGGKYYKHLGPAHDWNRNKAYAQLDYPAKYLSKHGVAWMYANNAKEMASKFIAGGDNYKTSGNGFKVYDSWQNHKLDWL